MKKSHKAILLSALILPGLGQLSLARRKRGTVLIVVVLVSLVAMIAVAMQMALGILDQIMAQGAVPDTAAITDAVSRATTTSGSTAFNTFFWIIIVCWVFGIIDAMLGVKETE